MNMQHKFSAPIPPITAPVPVFTKRKNYITSAIRGAFLALRATLTKIAAYVALACIVVSIVSQATVKAAVQKPQMKSGKLLLALSASLNHCRNGWWQGAGFTVEYQYIRHFAYCLAGCFRGFSKFNCNPVPEMAHHTGYTSAEKKGISRRYQNSVEEFFLIPCRYQFSIGEFFLIRWWYQFQIGNFILIPQRPPPRFVSQDPERLTNRNGEALSAWLILFQPISGRDNMKPKLLVSAPVLPM